MRKKKMAMRRSLTQKPRGSSMIRLPMETDRCNSQNMS
jgi:hypothetical protein